MKLFFCFFKNRPNDREIKTICHLMLCLVFLDVGEGSPECFDGLGIESGAVFLHSGQHSYAEFLENISKLC